MEEGILYILLIILGVSLGNLYGVKKIFALEKRMVALDEMITKKLLKAKTTKKRKRKR